jgi:hypothetical protein
MPDFDKVFAQLFYCWNTDGPIVDVMQASMYFLGIIASDENSDIAIKKLMFIAVSPSPSIPDLRDFLKSTLTVNQCTTLLSPGINNVSGIIHQNMVGKAYCGNEMFKLHADARRYLVQERFFFSHLCKRTAVNLNTHSMWMWVYRGFDVLMKHSQNKSYCPLDGHSEGFICEDQPAPRTDWGFACIQAKEVPQSFAEWSSQNSKNKLLQDLCRKFRLQDNLGNPMPRARNTPPGRIPGWDISTGPSLSGLGQRRGKCKRKRSSRFADEEASASDVSEESREEEELEGIEADFEEEDSFIPEGKTWRSKDEMLTSLMSQQEGALSLVSQHELSDDDLSRFLVHVLNSMQSSQTGCDTHINYVDFAVFHTRSPTHILRPLYQCGIPREQCN